MILKSLHLSNFKQYSSLELDFKEGLVGIVGRNGSGKSSLFEAVLLCLFGTASTGKGFYKTSWAEEKATVALELSFEVQAKVYRARREFRGKVLTHHAALYDQKDEQIANGVAAVNQEVARLLGMDKDAFTRSIFSGQKELSMLSSATKEERKLTIRRMIGLDNLDQIQRLVRADRNDYKAQIKAQEELLLSAEELKAKQKQLKEWSKQIKAAEKALGKCQQDFDKSNGKYQQAKADFGQQSENYQRFTQLEADRIRFEEGVAKLSDQLKELKEEALVLKEKQKSLKAELPRKQAYLKQKAQFEQLEADRRRFEKARNLRQQENLLSQELATLVDEVKRLEEKIKAEADVDQDLSDVQEQLKELATLLADRAKALDELIARRGGLKAKIKERQQQIAQIEALGKEAHCPTCLQPLINSYEQTIGRLSEEIEQFQNQQLQQLTGQIEEQEKAKEQQQKQQKTLEGQAQSFFARQQIRQENQQQLQARMETGKQKKLARQDVRRQIEALGNPQFDEQLYAQVQSQLNEEEAFYLAHITKEKEVARLEEVNAQIANRKERIANGNEKIKAQKQELKALKFSEEQYAKARQLMSQTEQVREQAQAALRQQELLLNNLQNEFKALQQELDKEEKNKQKIEQTKVDFQELDTLDEVFSQFKTYILSQVRPTIAQNASVLFEQITKGRYESIRVDDNFEFHILEDGEYYPITRFSGGEIDLANFCLRIGISRAIAELSGSTEAINFLAFDEIFGSQDDDRRFEILMALEHLKKQYQQIYIISHINSVKEYFPNILEVIKSPQGSTVSWK
ncbi:MAG: SMC family ATPase [Bacteroidota bacterium]